MRQICKFFLEKKIHSKFIRTLVKTKNVEWRGLVPTKKYWSFRMNQNKTCAKKLRHIGNNRLQKNNSYRIKWNAKN